jgi:hypothetical protein
MNKKTIEIFLVFLMCSVLPAQELIQNENRLVQLEEAKRIKAKNLDSLNIKLENYLEKIDSRKAQRVQSKDEIASLMARAFSISKKIESKELQLKKIHNNLQAIKNYLNNQYTVLIDSLQQDLTPNKSIKDKRVLEEEFLRLIEKRMQVSPILQTLSFDPKKIQDIKISATEDSLEKAIYIDYLQSALNDIDSHLISIGKKQNELEGMIRLEKKADIFISDIEDSRIFGFYEKSGEKNDNRDGGGQYNGLDYGERIDNNSQIDNFVILLNQLYKAGVEIEMPHRDESLYSGNEAQTLEQYLELVKKTRKYLEQYRKTVENKLNE